MNSQKPISPKSLDTAAEHLTQTDKGRQALKGLELFFDHDTGFDARRKIPWANPHAFRQMKSTPLSRRKSCEGVLVMPRAGEFTAGSR